MDRSLNAQKATLLFFGYLSQKSTICDDFCVLFSEKICNQTKTKLSNFIASYWLGSLVERSSSRFLAECRERRRDQDSFVLLCFCIVCFLFFAYSTLYSDIIF